MTDTAIKLVGEIQAAMENTQKEAAKIHAGLEQSINATSSEVKSIAKSLEEIATKVQAGATQVIELEQKLGEQVIKAKAAPKLLSDVILASDGYKAMAKGTQKKFRIEANTITGQEGSPPENSSVIVAPDRQAGIIELPRRNLRIRDVLPNAQTSSNVIEYTRATSRTLNAAETEEGALKPESDLEFELMSVNIRTIAHWIKASVQVLEDSPMLRNYIDNEMRYGVELRWDQQLLNGNGTNPNISGMLDTGNYTAFNATSGESALDSVNRAIALVEDADYSATAIIMHPADWHAIERLKVGASDNTYLVGNPLGTISRVLWGLPVVLTNQISRGRFIVGAFDVAYTIWNRQGVTVEMSEHDDDNFRRNLVTIRAEMRGALATKRPQSVYSGLLYAGASA